MKTVLVILLILHTSAASNLALLSGTLRTYQRHACDQSTLSLHCPAHTTIDVLYAHYGRPSTVGKRRAAPDDNNLPTASGRGMLRDEPPNTLTATTTLLPAYDPCPPIPELHQPPQECVMTEANYEILQRVVRDCQHKQLCKLQVHPLTFLKQDPCPTTRKYVEVAYKCRPATFINKVLCEGSEHVLRCDANARLAIYSVLFGRTVKGDIQCPQPANAPDEDCQASYATEVVMSACQGKRTCHLTADPKQFGGRPCSTLSRMYMKTVYTCVPRSILKPSFQSGLEPDESEAVPPVTPTARVPKVSPPYPGNAITTATPNQPSLGKEPSATVNPAMPPFFNPTVKPPPHNKVKTLDELSYRQHDQQHLPGSSPDLLNCTVTILADSKDKKIGFITDWMRTVGFITRNFEKFTLYLVLGLFCGLVALLVVVVGRLMLDKRRDNECNKKNQLTSVFSPAEEVDLDLTAPIGCSTLSRAGHSPDRASSPLPLPEVVRYNTTPRGIVTIRRQDSDIIVPPRSLSRTNNNQFFYS